MKYDPLRHHRRSIRLKGYDYTRTGWYYLTLCTQGRPRLFGRVINAKMCLSAAGEVARACWAAIPDHFPNVILHEYVIMPDHVHGIIEIIAPAEGSTPPSFALSSPKTLAAWRSPSKTVGSIVRGYKVGVTKWFRVHQPDRYPVGRRVWQRDYWEYIIRTEEEYERIARYIINNPRKWEEDGKG